MKRKVCTDCGKAKPLSRFSPSSRWPNGVVRQFNSRCKLCRRKEMAQRRKSTQGGQVKRYVPLCPCGCHTRGEHEYGFCEPHAARLAALRDVYDRKPKDNYAKGVQREAA